MNIDELETQISYYASKYYAGDPVISDEQFDMLVDRLRELKPDSRVLQTGWGFEVNGDKIKHKYSHIGSLDKTKTYQDIPDRFKQQMVYVSPKLDGLSAVAYYENGQLVKGITRGNGEYGKDITEKLYKILGKNIMDTKFTGAIRGELIINDKSWQKLQSKYVNLISARNFAAGIINRKELDEDIQYIDMVVYKVVGQENNSILKTRDEMIQWLELNFKNAIPLYYYPILNESSWNMYHEQTFKEFQKLGYTLDGLVLTNPTIIYDSITNGYIFDEVAFKFQAESTTTIVKEIEWELSRTQRMIPIAIVEPVELSGAIVERATCNNAQWVRDMELGKDAEIEICRSNEVIPQILSVLQPSLESLPKLCPICKQPLQWEGVDLKCVNKECSNIQNSDLQQWCENVGETDGLQWTLMQQYLLNFNIINIDDLYESSKMQFVLDTLNSRKLSITELKIKEFFEKLYIKDIDIKQALIGLNVPRLGIKTATILMTNKQVIQNLMLISINKLDINDNWTRQILLDLVKDATTESIYKNINKFSKLCYVYKRLIFSDNTKDNIKYVAVTGSLNTMKRKDFETYILKYGYELTSNLKKCEYLITNNPESGSSKINDAKKYNIKIITEKEFLDNL